MGEEAADLTPCTATFSLKTMENSSTPKKKASNSVSSVFLTPPVSTERRKVSTRNIPPLPPAPGRMPSLFSTPGETPTLPPRPLRSRPKLALCDGEDVVSGLYEGGYRMLTRQILYYLEPSDLYNSTLVCHRWSQLILSFPDLQTRIRHYHKEFRQDAENMVKPFPSLTLDTGRKPLGDAKNRLLRNGHASTPSLPPQASIIPPKRVMYKHRHCPQCKAVSKQLNLRRAECTKCSFDYCSACLKEWHDGECERQRSPKRPSKESSIGSKRSKKNLRRL